MTSQNLKIDFIETASHMRLAAALHRQCFAKPWDESAFASAMTIPGTVLALASREDEPVALALFRHIRPEAEILTLGVLPEFRQLKIAGALLDHGKSYLLAREVNTLWLEVGSRNLAARRLYDSHGFEEAGRRKGYYQQRDGNEDAVVMKLPLFSSASKK